MSTMSLAEARIKLNMPFASDKEVRAAALRNNIQIIDLNLGGIQNTASWNAGSHLGGSLFGASTTPQASDLSGSVFGGGSASPAQPSLAMPMTGSGDGIYGDMGLSLNRTNSLDKGLTLDNTDLNNKSANKLQQRTDNILKQVFGDQQVQIKSQEVRNGKNVVTMADGTTVEITLQEGEEGYDPTKVRSDVAYKVLKNGKVTTTLADGRELKARDARNGEEGYVKDGESIDERLKRCYPAAYKAADTPEKKAALIKSYFQSYYKELEKRGTSKEKIARLQKSDFGKLMKNTAQDSEWAQIMGQSLHTLRAENRVDAYNNLADMAGTDDLVVDATTSMIGDIGESNDDKAVQNALIVSAQERISRLRNIPPEKRAELNDNVIKGIEKCNPEAQELLLKVMDNDACTTQDIAHLSQLFGEDENGNRVLTPEAEKFAQQIMVRRSNDRESIGHTAYATSRMRRENQLEGAQYAYENVKPELQGALNEGFADNIHHFDTENVLPMQQQVLDHDDEEHNGAKILAGHGQELDASIQTEYAQILTNLGVEDVSEILANHAYEYDLSSREDVIKMLKEQGFDKTMSALEQAKAEYEAQNADNQETAALIEEQNKENQKAQNEQSQTQTQTQTQENRAQRQNNNQRIVEPSTVRTPVAPIISTPIGRTSANLNTIGLTQVQKYVLSSEFRSADIKTKQNYISQLNATDRKQAIGTLIDSSTDAELSAYMFSGLKKDILSYLVNHPTGNNKESLHYLKGFLSGADLKMVEEMQEERKKMLGLLDENITSSTPVAPTIKVNPFNIEA